MTTDVSTDTTFSIYFSQAYIEAGGSSQNRANLAGFMNSIEYRFTGYVTASGDTNWAYTTGRVPGIVPYEVWDIDTNTRLFPLYY